MAEEKKLSQEEADRKLALRLQEDEARQPLVRPNQLLGIVEILRQHLESKEGQQHILDGIHKKFAANEQVREIVNKVSESIEYVLSILYDAPARQAIPPLQNIIKELSAIRDLFNSPIIAQAVLDLNNSIATFRNEGKTDNFRENVFKTLTHTQDTLNFDELLASREAQKQAIGPRR